MEKYRLFPVEVQSELSEIVFEIMRVFLVFSLHAFDFLKLMVRISTQYNYSEEQLCGIEELIKFYVDSFHYEHRVLLY